jgi:hypothetical protein
MTKEVTEMIEMGFEPIYLKNVLITGSSILHLIYDQFRSDMLLKHTSN